MEVEYEYEEERLDETAVKQLELRQKRRILSRLDSIVHVGSTDTANFVVPGRERDLQVELVRKQRLPIVSPTKLAGFISDLTVIVTDQFEGKKQRINSVFCVAVEEILLFLGVQTLNIMYGDIEGIKNLIDIKIRQVNTVSETPKSFINIDYAHLEQWGLNANKADKYMKLMKVFNSVINDIYLAIKIDNNLKNIKSAKTREDLNFIKSDLLSQISTKYFGKMNNVIMKKFNQLHGPIGGALTEEKEESKTETDSDIKKLLDELTRKTNSIQSAQLTQQQMLANITELQNLADSHGLGVARNNYKPTSNDMLWLAEQFEPKEASKKVVNTLKNYTNTMKQFCLSNSNNNNMNINHESLIQNINASMYFISPFTLAFSVGSVHVQCIRCCYNRICFI